MGYQSLLSSSNSRLGVLVQSLESVDLLGEQVDDDYFASLNTVAPESQATPTPLGVETGIITDDQIIVSSFYGEHTAIKARGNSMDGWIPSTIDSNPWIRLDLGKVMEIHGLGTKGHYSEAKWVTEYTVYISEDGTSYSPLLNQATGQPRVFLGNSDQTTWKNHCLHRYYGFPPKARYVEFRLLRNNGNGYGMRVELYGFRDAEDEALLKVLKRDVSTRSTTGCQCYFDPTKFDCACCYEGAIQCPAANKHQCIRADYAITKCGIPDIRVRGIQDLWTVAFTGELCHFDPSRGSTCAQCAVGGCQCPRNPNQCVQCGHTEACGKKESVFGVNSYCDITASCAATVFTKGNSRAGNI
jgi:hypothetical protein